MRPSLLLLPTALCASPAFLTAQNTQQRMTGVAVGLLAPDIAMRGPDGDTLRLSQLRGKVVLLDFWASWCRPCRMDNPNVVQAYRTYKDTLFTAGEGFSVFSVSLDRVGAEAQWKAAIAQDSLEWPTHVSAVEDGNNEAANRYGVRYIPANALLDQNGNVIAMELHGTALAAKLESLLERDPKKLQAFTLRKHPPEKVEEAPTGKKADERQRKKSKD